MGIIRTYCVLHTIKVEWMQNVYTFFFRKILFCVRNHRGSMKEGTIQRAKHVFIKYCLDLILFTFILETREVYFPWKSVNCFSLLKIHLFSKRFNRLLARYSRYICGFYNKVWKGGWDLWGSNFEVQQLVPPSEMGGPNVFFLLFGQNIRQKDKKFVNNTFVYK